MSDNIKRVTYGEWVIDVDIEKTTAFYSEFKLKDTQCSRNFAAYCKQLSEAEKEFFDNLAVLPTSCINAMTIGLNREGNYPTYGCYYIAGSYAKTPKEILWTPEDLVEHDYIDDRPNPTITIGAFDFNFQKPDSLFAQIPDDMPEGFICIQFSAENVTWLLDEECEEKRYYPPKWWQLIKKTRQAKRNRQFNLEYKKALKNELISELDSIGITYEELTAKDIRSYEKQWVLSFSQGKFKEAKKVCLSNSNYLWHLFSFEIAAAKQGEIASSCYDANCHSDCIALLNFEKMGFKLNNASKLSSGVINKFNDIIITDIYMKWTYCHTHETYCGPYFCKIK